MDNDLFSCIPLDRVVESRSISMFKNNIFRMHWILGRYCNYNCSYCWPKSHSSERDPVMNLSYYTGAIDKISNQASLNGFSNFIMTLSGGEPTLHPHILPIVSHFSARRTPDKIAALTLVTNLSRGENWLSQFAEAGSNLNYIQVVASWHREFSDLRKFKERALHLMSLGINVDINVTFAVNLFESYYQDASYLRDAGLNVKALPERSASQKPYTDQQLSILQQDWVLPGQNRLYLNKMPNFSQGDESLPSGYSMELIDDLGNKYYVDYPERFPSLGFVNFEGWLCYAGFQNICIEADGSLHRGKAGCRNVVLGNIFNRSANILYSKPQLCNKKSCDAATDSIMRKIKIVK